MFQLTPVVKNLLIINVVIWIGLQLLNVAGFEIIDLLIFTLHKSNALGLHEGRGDFFRPYQLVTYFFNHDKGIFHILFNMYVLASLGPMIEAGIGSKPFLRFYLFCGILGGILIAFLDPSHGPVIGASVAVSGVLVAFAQMYPNQRLGILFIPVSFGAKQFVSAIFLFSAVMVYLEIMGINAGGSISHFGHMVGMIAAVIFYQLARYFPILLQR